MMNVGDEPIGIGGPCFECRGTGKLQCDCAPMEQHGWPWFQPWNWRKCFMCGGSGVERYG